MTTDTTKTTERDAFLAGLGLTYDARFVPQSLSRNSGNRTPSLNWRVTIGRTGRKPVATDYTQGIGCLPGWPAYPGNPRSLANDEADREAAERVRWGGRVKGDFAPGPRRSIPAPLLADVLYSLVQDTDVLGYDSFESWAPEVGFDPDSRKAEAIWHECRKLGQAFRALFTAEEYAALCSMFEGY